MRFSENLDRQLGKEFSQGQRYPHGSRLCREDREICGSSEGTGREHPESEYSPCECLLLAGGKQRGGRGKGPALQG